MTDKTRTQHVEPDASAAYLADDVSIGALVRWINDAHLDAAKETPPNMDRMRAMQQLGQDVQNALGSYRRSIQPQGDLAHQIARGRASHPSYSARIVRQNNKKSNCFEKS